MAEEVEYDGGLMPNDGEVFYSGIPDTIISEVEEERAMVKSSGPLITRLLSFYDEQIKQTDNIDSLDLGSDMDPQDLLVQLLAQRRLKNLLYAAKSDLENLRDAHIKS
jgi:hypothetical protein